MKLLRRYRRHALLGSAFCVLVGTGLLLQRWWTSLPPRPLFGVPAQSGLPGAPPASRLPYPAKGTGDGQADGERACGHLYSIEDVTPVSRGYSEAYGINAAGHVVGQVQTNQGAFHAFIWCDGTTRDLGTLPGGSSSAARSINGLDQVVGWADGTNGAPRAFAFCKGAMSDLGSFGGLQSDAYSVNRLGQVAGNASTPNGEQHAFLYSGGVMRDLGTLGGRDSEACGINDRGQVVGWAETLDGTRHAFLSAGDAMTDLGTLGGSASVARGINRAGVVVGIASTGSAGHAFLWRRRVMKDLGTLGGSNSDAFGINDRDLVVGKARIPSGEVHAFLYAGKTIEDLNRRIVPGTDWLLTAAYAINDAGQIVGVGVHRGRRRAFLLTLRRARLGVH
jgi:probable HAF family extracellular repeat protein